MSDRCPMEQEEIEVWSDSDVDEFWYLMYLSNRTAYNIVELVEKHR